MRAAKDDEQIHIDVSKPWQVCLSPLSIPPYPGTQRVTHSPLLLHNSLRHAAPETSATRGDPHAWDARALKERRYGVVLRVGLGSFGKVRELTVYCLVGLYTRTDGSPRLL